jgi:multiple sugar transport system permease protein
MKKTNSEVQRLTPYRVISIILLVIMTVLFVFPLYWIITGSFKDRIAVNAAVPMWFPVAPTMDNFVRLFERPAMLWLFNTVLVCVMAMILTCVASAMGGYVLAKKRFRGRKLLFSIFVCAMALPKQVILIPLLKEMSFLGIHNTLWAVILPASAWPFGVFLMKQFSEGIPGEMLEAANIDGAGEARTFLEIVFPMIKPGVGALAIFTFISTWNDYFLQLIMLNSSTKLTISLGIAKLQTEMSNDFGLIMAGAALGSIPIILIFLLFQKFFTRGITMGAVKG